MTGSFAGCRRGYVRWPNLIPRGKLRDGDYWKVLGAPEGDPTWAIYHGGIARISNHYVEEHDDGTISVEPQPGNSNSILLSGSRPWHGYIRRGVWEPC